MDNPLSHTSAVTAAVLFIILLILSLSFVCGLIPWSSLTAWMIFILVASMLAASIFSYFHPNSKIVLVPVVLSGLTLLFLCIYQYRTHGQNDLYEFYKTAVLFLAWLQWAARKVWQLKQSIAR